MNKKILLLLILLLLASLNYLKTSKQNSPYKLDSFIYEQIFWQLKGDSYQLAKEKVFSDKKILFDETVKKIIGNEIVYKNVYSLFLKRPFYPTTAYILNFFTHEQTLAFALPPFAAYLGIITVFYFLCLKVLNPAPAALSSLFLTFYNPLVISSASFMSDTLGTFFWMVNLILILQYLKNGKRKFLALFLICEVLALTVREQNLLMLPLSLILVLTFRFLFKNKLLLKRSVNIALPLVIILVIYHLVIYVFSHRTFVDAILYLQSGYLPIQENSSLTQFLEFYLHSLFTSHVVFAQVLAKYPWRLLFLVMAALGVKRTISDRKNSLINSVMFASGIASYLAIYAFPVPNPRYFFPLVASIIYFAVYFVTNLRSKGNLKPFYIIIAVLFISAAMIFPSIFKSDQEKLEKLLTGVDISRFGSKSDIKTLRLAAFYQWNKEDPLFTSADFDVEAFKKSVNYLVEEQDILLKFINKTDHAYPTNFLSKMADAAEAHQNFMTNPSDKNAQILNDLQLEAAHLYKKEAINLQKPVSEAKFYSPILLNTTTNKDVTIKDLKTIAKNGNELSGEIERRKACLQGTGTCTRPANQFKKPAIRDFPDPDIKLLPKDLVYFEENKEGILGPFGSRSLCYGYGENLSQPTNYFYLKESPDGFLNIKPITVIKLATNMYFEKITPQTNLYYKKKLLESDMPYAGGGSTLPYKCPYFGFLSEVTTLHTYLTDNKPILNGFTQTDKFMTRAIKAESSFFSRKYPSYEEAQQLADIYAYIYKMSQNNNSIGNDSREELLKRKLKIERKLLNFGSVLNYLTRYIRGTRISLEVEVKGNSDHTQTSLYPEFSSNLIYPIRSYYGLTYLPFSRSLWRLDQTPQYVEKKIIKGLIGFDSVIIDYQTARERYSEEEIKRWLVPRWDVISDCAFRNICN